MARGTKKAPTGDAASGDTGSDTPINSQINATLEALDRQVTENPDALARAGLELATAQALAMAVQDAVDHVRRMQMLTEAMVAKALSPGASTADQGAASSASEAVQSAMSTLEKATALANSAARSAGVKS